MKNSESTKLGVPELKAQAKESRKLILKMLAEAGSGHPGGSLSAIDIITALFFSEMKLDPKNPQWESRDRFVLSKGHGVPALYATLAYRGYFSPEETMSLRKLGSPFQGHPDRVRMPAVEASTGSLGQGLSVAQGIAMSLKLDKIDSRVYCLLGDGELQEGQVWECLMSCAKYNLDNLCVFLDSNKYQIDGSVKEVMDLDPIKDKIKSFNWNVLEIDGHDMTQIVDALAKAKATHGKPTWIVANTVKGKGVSFMESVNKWHGVTPTPEELTKALAELEK
ncbi:MAG: transketolase [Bdellovibrionales bacterium]|nr:transketolase [Bdellovibrionales bacterium]